MLDLDRQKQGRRRTGDIAVIAMCCNFPGANSVELFESNLFAGVESIRRFSDQELAAAGVPVRVRRSKDYVPVRPRIEGADLFDAAYFGYSPREAELMDPQQRLFLEAAHSVLEKAGYNPFRYMDRIGVFAGTAHNGYFYHHVWKGLGDGDDGARLEAAIANDKDHLATRVAYKLNLRGPAITVQTACSTSLVAIVMAVDALRSGRADMALAGGVSISSRGDRGYIHRKGGILSDDGRCRPFDASGSGTVFGDGLGIVLLKPLGDALRDGDTIDAVIKGAALNNDGASKVGYTAPSVDGQLAVITAALDDAGVEAASVGFVETHGTATPVGDPIEFRALRDAFGPGRAHRCALGSVKANVGHLNAAAGVAGFIKAVIAVRRGSIPPHPNFETLNPQISFAGSPFFVNTSAVSWPADLPERIAGVSSFGIGGTNAHVVVAAAPARAPTLQGMAGARVLPVSARSASALATSLANVSAALRSSPSLALHDAAHTLQQGRRVFEHRAAVVAGGLAEAIEQLDAKASSPPRSAARPRRIAFLFPGQGVVDRGEARILYDTLPGFRSEFDRCAHLFEAQLGFDVGTSLRPGGSRSGASVDVRATLYAQPFMFSVSYAFARTLMAWGVSPAALAGHSLGEYVAATIAGSLAIDDAVEIVSRRAILMEAAPEGRMMFVALDERRCRELMGSSAIDAEIAAVNAPNECVVAGGLDALAGMSDLLTRQDIDHVMLNTTRAFHSRAMGAAARALSDLMERKPIRPPTTPFVSNLTGTWISEAEVRAGDYWKRHALSPVLFAEGLASLIEAGIDLFVEVGVGNTLRRMVDRHPDRGHVEVVGVSPSARSVERLAARLWELGVDIEWTDLQGERGKRVSLPTYPFQHKSFWIEPQDPAPPGGAKPETELEPTRDVFAYAMNWTRLPPVSPRAGEFPTQWLVFGSDDPLTRAVMRGLDAAAGQVTLVQDGHGPGAGDSGRAALRATDKRDYIDVLRSVAAAKAEKVKILHLWSARPSSSLDPRDEAVASFHSLLWIAQAIDEVAPTVAFDVTVVTQGLHDVESADACIPGRAMVVGPRNVVPREMRNVSVHTVDVTQSDLDGDCRAVALRVIAETEAVDGCKTVALRGSKRWVPALDRVELPPYRRQARSKAGQVWVITGGPGETSLSLARHVAEDSPAAIVLLTHGAFPARSDWAVTEADAACDAATRNAVPRLLAMERFGVRVEMLRCDLGVERDVDTVMDDVRRRHGRIDVIVHAAEVTQDGPARDRTRIGVEEAWRLKIGGAIALMKGASRWSVGTVVLTSAIEAIRGGEGRIGHVAANAVLAALAQAEEETGSRVYTIGWPSHPGAVSGPDGRTDGRADRWAAGGGANMDARLLDRVGEITDQVLAQSRRQVWVTVDALSLEPFRLSRPSEPSVRPTIREAAGAAPVKGGLAAAASQPRRRMHVRPSDLDVDYAVPESDIETRLGEIWSSLLGIGGIGIDDNFFALGGHSLLAVRLTFRVREAFEVEFGLNHLFDNPTVRSSAREIVLLQLSSLPEQDLLALLSEVEAPDGMQG